MFLVILFLISGKVIVGGEDSDESKYIDLLPEEEKENFLQRIAKRIFEENNAANAEAKVSGELHDEQLEQHDDFVNKILKEETTNARRDEADDQDDGFKVKPLERERRSDFNEEVVSANVADTNVDGNIELYDGSKNHTVSEEKDTDSKESEIILIKPLPEEDIASTDTVNYNYDETNQTTATDDMLSTTYGTPIKITEKPEIFLNETHIFLKARSDSNLTVERSQDKNLTYPINIIEATTNDFRNPTTIDEGVEVISEDTPTNIDTNNTATEASVSQSDNNYSSILVNKTDSIVLSTTTNSTANDSEITTNNNIEYKNNLNVKNNVERSRVSQSFSSDNKVLNDDMKTKKENSDADNNNNVLDENLSDHRNEKRPRLRKKPKNERESYVVYEIDPTRPFTAKGIITNAEQPHYVPIYDYSSKNAYFNPKNLNGPNHDNKEAITDTIKQINTILNGYKVGGQLSLPVIAGNGNGAIGREMPQAIYASQHNDDAELLSSVHPYRSYIPDTNENFYSYSTMNGLKDGLSAVRKILYEKQRFGFVDPDKSFEYVSENFTGSPTDKTVLRETLKSDHKNAKFITDWSILKRISTKGENLPHPRNVLLSQKNRMKMKIPDTTKYIRLKDLLKAYDYLKEFSGNSKGRGDEVDAYVTVLNDMMITKNRMLRKYDWLGSTVKLRSAMKKLSSLLSSLENNERIHSSDLEMLKYIFLLHNRAKTELLSEIRLLYRTLNQHNIQNGFSRRPQAYSNGMVKQKTRSVFLDRNEVDELKGILGLLANSLYDLHDALKFISIVTKSNKQRWYENLEELYIRNTKKQLLEILVHIFANEFVDLVEEGLQNGANEDSKSYLIYHGEHVNNTVNIYLTLMKLLRKFIKLKIL